MIKAKVGFVVYGVHKDGLKDPDGNLFIDYDIIERSKKALRDSGLTLVEGRDVLEAKGIKVEHDNDIVATKKEANEIILPMAKDDSIDCLVLFSGTWVWAAHMIGAIREFAKTGKGIVIWTYPGSQGWRPVGGLVLKALCIWQGGGSEGSEPHPELLSGFRGEEPHQQYHDGRVRRSRHGSDLRRGGSRAVDENLRHRYRFPRYHRASGNCQGGDCGGNRRRI